MKTSDKTVFGFWVYIMTDCIVFASLFATYAVLHGATFGGPDAKSLFSLPSALHETLILLTSSFTCGLAMLAAHRGRKRQALLWLAATLALGLAFLGVELREFSQFAAEGASWQRSAFLSSFFALVGTHGLHVALGSLWMLILMVQLAVKGLSEVMLRRLMCLSLFWHFLDIVWIFIFTIVYLMGAL